MIGIICKVTSHVKGVDFQPSQIILIGVIEMIYGHFHSRDWREPLGGAERGVGDDKCCAHGIPFYAGCS
jgi:hypothetical protein